MSFLLEKSEQNKNAFFFLKGKCKAPMLHCAYYSCYQKIVYFLQEHYTDIWDEMNKVNPHRGGRGNSHGQCIREFTKIHEGHSNRKEAHYLKSILNDLKSYRIEADYDNKEIIDINLEKAEKHLNFFHKAFQRYYKI